MVVPEGKREFPLPDYLLDEPPFEFPSEPGSTVDEELPIILVQKAQWSDRAVNPLPMKTPIRAVKFTSQDVYKYDDYLAKALRKMQDYYMDVMKQSDVPFNFLVDEGGLVYEGRGWKAASTRGNDTLEIAFLGTYKDKFERPSFTKCEAAHSLIMQGVRQQLLNLNFEIISMKNRADYSQKDLEYFPTHESDLVSVDAPFGN